MVLALFLLFGLYVGNIVIILYYIFPALAISLDAPRLRRVYNIGYTAALRSAHGILGYIIFLLKNINGAARLMAANLIYKETFLSIYCIIYL